MNQEYKHAPSETMPTPKRLDILDHALRTKPETFGDLEASMLFLDSDYFHFKDAMIELGKLGKTFDLVFLMDDLGESDQQKKMRLRQLKAILEDRKLRPIVTKITVKGLEGSQAIEPNVFASDVLFERIS